MALKLDLLCYVRGQGDRWEAICVDLDLAVQASSMKEAFASIESAIKSYVDDALNESELDCDRLLTRRSPWHLRAALWLQYQMYMLTRRRPHAESYSAFSLPCPA